MPPGCAAGAGGYGRSPKRAGPDGHEAQPHTRRFLAERETLLESKQVDFLALADAKLPVPPSALRSSSGAVDIPGE